MVRTSAVPDLRRTRPCPGNTRKNGDCPVKLPSLFASKLLGICSRLISPLHKIWSYPVEPRIGGQDFFLNSFGMYRL